MEAASAAPTNPLSVHRTCVWREWAAPSLEERGLGWATTGTLMSSSLPFPSSLPLTINYMHRPLRSVVSCYLVTSCHDLPGPLVFPWRLCPSCHLLGYAVPMVCSHPGPWPHSFLPPRLMVPQGCQCVFMSHCSPSPCLAAKCNFWLLVAVADWADKERWYNGLIMTHIIRDISLKRKK